MKQLNNMGRRGINKLISLVASTRIAYRICDLMPRQRSGSGENCISELNKVSPRPPRIARVERSWGEPVVDLSVIVPVYNAEKWIEECIGSIESQETVYTYEIIAVNDGSPDRTPEILRALAERDSRIHVIDQENKGFSGARNAGIDHVRGRCLMFVDSDDVLLPGAIESLMSEFDKSGCDFVTANYREIVDGKLQPVKGRRDHGAPWGRVYDREVWTKLSFPEGLWFEDTVQAMCIDPYFSEEYLEVPVYGYRINSAGITATSSRFKKSVDTFWVVEELLAWDAQDGRPLDERLRQTVLWQLGPIAVWRTMALNGKEMRTFFQACSYVYRKYFPKETPNGISGGRELIARALREGNYGLWRLACAREK